ncbi:ubiquinone anaerobic biosynthesis protein UbiV [Rhodospirillum rubrum]|uniref:Ubiquinone biosynthesis protein UbiV n=1 Tax=Rhodospirillum rubrum (strain ATCC 11170 / ATH 1.1.1 / DSM 467 / LMG 4362 / NCIMB 8255 / S1) TaxID=269796 RepID=Q2RRC1_RHORT|nr:U32 family peptidase [Rhodospirillum rubrum]ABC23324.1 Peptidase U32 [Rhodospirillum rubrum ATCC 11170]AEO49057.1 putative protease [Rhodospirillum rubrum F11]MBK5954967.1 U32 family peptidase [Rhodospirillum rubrum]QXG79297.1 U32 family peptidase [Rhodospirillum rubrum]HAQ01282.1 U32 family peptidase [Rhodospirillum rubrum]
MTRVDIALGPLTYNWPADKRRAFYEDIAKQPVFDMVYMGETICAKRSAIVGEAMADSVLALEAAGRTVVYSTLSLAITDPERQAITDVAADRDLLVEGNDAGALRACAGRPHHVGPHVNVYNEGTLDVLAARGATSICLPWELERASIERLAARARHHGMVAEVEVFGKAPLAISARCHHARAYGLAKDGCQYVCGKDLEGMPVDTLDGEAFLTLNGLQTQADAVTLLVSEIASLVEAGVGRLRLSPLNMDMGAVAGIYRALLDGALEADVAQERLITLLGDRAVANGFYYGIEGSSFAA